MNAPGQLPLIRIKGDTVTLLAWQHVSIAQIIAVVVALALPALAFFLWGWWVASWLSLIPAQALWFIAEHTSRSGLRRLQFSSIEPNIRVSRQTIQSTLALG